MKPHDSFFLALILLLLLALPCFIAPLVLSIKPVGSRGYCNDTLGNMDVNFDPKEEPPTPNYPPEKPSDPCPADKATGVSTSTQLSVLVTDPDGNPMDVSFYHVIPRKPIENFTIIALPDTQYYSESHPEIFNNQTQWIVDNKEKMNIVFVTHEGDIVNVYSSIMQWNNANESMSKLDTANIAYGLALGNHDNNGGADYTYYNMYFPYSRYSGKLWYGGAYMDNNANSFQLFEIGEDKYMVLHLEYNPNASVLAWADSIIDSHQDRRVILTTHYYLQSSGERSKIGQNLWNNLVSEHADQIFLVLCGHVIGEASKTDVVDGHTVYQLLANYQNYLTGGNGWLRILDFRPTEDKIYVKTYSPYLNQYETDADSQFTLDYNMTGVTTPPPVLIGMATDVPSGGRASIQWNGLELATTYYWFAVAEDAEGCRTQSDIWSFTTLTTRAENVYLGLTVKPNQAKYGMEQKLTFTVDIYNLDNPALEATLTVTITGPEGYSFFDLDRIWVAADSVGEYSFEWKAPSKAGKYVVEVSLVPARLMAYDCLWLEVE